MKGKENMSECVESCNEDSGFQLHTQGLGAHTA